PCREHTKLKWRRKDITLPDSGHEGFTLLPSFLVGRLLPEQGGNEAATRAGNFDAGRLSEAQTPRACLQRIDAELHRDLIEIAVAGVLDAEAQVHRAMAPLLPAVELMCAEPHDTRAGGQSLGGDDAFIESRECGDRLEGRARRISAGQHFVEQRLVIAFRQLV